MQSISQYLFHPQVIIRTPFYKFNIYERKLDAVTKDTHFTTAILLSSKSLFQTLQKKDFQYDHLSEKEKLSIKQYFNRMCFRPTPFGLFAGISVSFWTGNERKLLFKESDKVKTLVDFEHSVLIAEQIINHQHGFPINYSLNPSLYRVNSEYRYIKFVQDKDGKRTFLIESIELSDVLANVLSYFQEDRRLDEIIHFIVDEYNITLEDSRIFVNELIERQVILSDLLPNITGSDYHNYVIEKLDSTGILSTDNLIVPGALLINCRSVIDFKNNFLADENRIQVLSGFKTSMKNPLYVNLERNCSSGGVPAKIQEKLLRGLFCLQKLVPDYQNDRLIKFKEDFRKKFDLKWMPLLTTLDPEVGIGYCSLEKRVDQCDLMGNIQINNIHKDEETIQWTHYQTFLMNKWNTCLQKDNGVPILELTEEELNAMEQQESTGTMPPSIAILFRKVGESVYIEEAGGASAISMMGRFTAFNESIKEAAEQLSEIEQSTNSDVLFAEIAHLSDFDSANVNRRAAIRQYEIPVATGSRVDKEHQIPLNDLWVSVVEDEIILWSKKLCKRIIPRLSSAYNFLRSDLPVFRFLCDLQFQKIRSSLSLNLSNLFPGLSFYPRIQYKDAILHLASWHINKETVDSILAGTDSSSQLAALKELASKLEWPQHISVNRQDNYIVIDTSIAEELAFLLKLVKKKGPLIIQEFPFISNIDKSCNEDKYDNYITEYTAIMYHKQKVYEQVAPRFSESFSPKNVQRKFIPGSDWHYFKIYCHPARANEILINHIVPLCERWIGAGFIEKWFFIRYRDPDYHLRIRLHSHPVNTGLLIRGFNRILSQLNENQIVSNLQTDIYEREIERYGADIIEDIECAFFSSTTLITKFLANISEGNPVNSIFRMAYCSVAIILDNFNCNLEDRITLFERLYQSMKSEFSISKTENEQLKLKFRALKSSDSFLPVSHIITQYNLTREASYFQYTHNKIFRLLHSASSERKDDLVGNIIHMHLNRLFASSPRKNEFVIYYCLWKYYVSEAGRQRKLSSGLFVDQHRVDNRQ